jgi:hypothetical protein
LRETLPGASFQQTSGGGFNEHFEAGAVGLQGWGGTFQASNMPGRLTDEQGSDRSYHWTNLRLEGLKRWEMPERNLQMEVGLGIDRKTTPFMYYDFANAETTLASDTTYGPRLDWTVDIGRGAWHGRFGAGLSYSAIHSGTQVHLAAGENLAVDASSGVIHDLGLEDLNLGLFVSTMWSSMKFHYEQNGSRFEGSEKLTATALDLRVTKRF